MKQRMTNIINNRNKPSDGAMTDTSFKDANNSIPDKSLLREVSAQGEDSVNKGDGSTSSTVENTDASQKKIGGIYDFYLSELRCERIL